MCFAIFELIKFRCFGSTLSYPHKEFLNSRPPRTRTQSNAGSRPANAGTRNSRGLTRPAQDSTTNHISLFSKILRILLSIVKASSRALSTSRKHTTGFLVKSFV